MDIRMQGEKIERLNETKFLGVTIDTHLSWKPHINNVCNKLSKIAGILTKARRKFSNDVMLKLYHSMVYPHLNYCAHVWGDTYQTDLYRLNLIQKRIIRLISGVPFRAHTEELFKGLNLLDVRSNAKYNILLFMHDFINNRLPYIFTNYFTENSQIHSYNTRSNNMLHPAPYRTNVRKFSIKITGCKLWNELPNGLKTINSKFIFKRELKSYLLGKGGQAMR
jgi:hypothetical protein